MSEAYENSLLKNDRDFYRQMAKVGIPVMVQQLILVAVGICDTIMVGKLSEEALASGGTKNYAEIAQMFGIDANSKAFWESALKSIESEIDELEKLCDSTIRS